MPAGLLYFHTPCSIMSCDLEADRGSGQRCAHMLVLFMLTALAEQGNLWLWSLGISWGLQHAIPIRACAWLLSSKSIRWGACAVARRERPLSSALSGLQQAGVTASIV